MKVQQVVPREEPVDLRHVVRTLGCGATLKPFSSAILQFCSDYSRAIFADAEARRYPELQALAFWMRKAELVRLRDDFHKQEDEHLLRVPRGIVFHLPPGNVDVIFVYSWLMAVLTGNRNVLRLSTRPSRQADILCRLYLETLRHSDAALADSTVMIRYGHEKEITAELSSICDLRVIWGGDATVNAIRAIPLPPHATELTFADRFSLCAIQARRYLETSARQREQLAVRFYNDMFWFDQMACSSPRLLIWCGDREGCATAAGTFFEALLPVISQKHDAGEPANRMNKFTFACRAILDGTVVEYQECGPHLTVLPLRELANFREHCGGGMIFQFQTPNLETLADVIVRRDQTLSWFGFSNAELRAFAELVNGRGIDRFVPLGSALAFQRYWDGYDLLEEMTRCVAIMSESNTPDG